MIQKLHAKKVTSDRRTITAVRTASRFGALQKLNSSYGDVPAHP
jgi:hypothetical protein